VLSGALWGWLPLDPTAHCEASPLSLVLSIICYRSAVDRSRSSHLYFKLPLIATLNQSRLMTASEQGLIAQIRAT
jgi:hypothetical protein